MFFCSQLLKIVMASLLIALALPSGMAEQELPSKTDNTLNKGILLSANEIIYQENDEVVIARGNVEVVRENQVLHAQEIHYNRKTDTLIARGNVIFKEPEVLKTVSKNFMSEQNAFLNHQDLTILRLRQEGTLLSNPLNLPDLTKQLSSNQLNSNSNPVTVMGNKYTFMPYAEFTGSFQNGFIRDIKMLMSDNARLAANSAKRIDGRKMIFRQAVYSPCHICTKNPEKPPLWQLKADKIIHSKDDQLIIYHHARLEMGGVPVFYFPYFRQADSTVKKKTGILMPSYATISDLGAIVSMPFYYVIAPNRDLTLVPIITTRQGPVIVGEYRHRLGNGEFTATGSFTQTRDLKRIPKSSGLPGSNRWHIFTQGRFDLNDEHVATFDINRASDTTYLRRYPILPQGFRLKYPIKNLVSTGAVEQFKNHSYGTVRTTVYQTDNSQKTPYVLPHAWYNYQSDPTSWNSIWNFDADFLSLGRAVDTPGQNARTMQRMSLNSRWRLPYITPFGHMWTLQAALRGDAYSLEHYQPTLASSRQRAVFRGRIFPTGTLQWKYPLVKNLATSRWVLEPTAMLIGTPRVSNSNIPNEDSLNIQIEDTSLFLPQRYSGLDRVDSGGRFVYGANSTWFFPRQKLVQLFLGHSLRLDRRQTLPIYAGENKQASDIVSRLRINPISGIQFLNRMAIDHRRARPRISDTSAIFGKKLLILQLNHTFVNKFSTANSVGISQASWVIGSRPFDHWSFSAGETRNLHRHQKGALSHTLSALYHDECFRMTLSGFRTHSSDRDIRPNTGVVVQFDFKNLGTVSVLDSIGINTNNIF
jgi:LPS-assembly protein